MLHRLRGSASKIPGVLPQRSQGAKAAAMDPFVAFLGGCEGAVEVEPTEVAVAAVPDGGGVFGSHVTCNCCVEAVRESLHPQVCP